MLSLSTAEHLKAPCFDFSVAPAGFELVDGDVDFE